MFGLTGHKGGSDKDFFSTCDVDHIAKLYKGDRKINLPYPVLTVHTMYNSINNVDLGDISHCYRTATLNLLLT